MPKQLETGFHWGPAYITSKVKGSHRPKTHNEKYIGETYDEH